MALHRCTLIAVLPHMYPETLHLSLHRKPFLFHYIDQITGPISLTSVHFCLNVIDQDPHVPLPCSLSPTQHMWHSIFSSELGLQEEIRVEERGM